MIDKDFIGRRITELRIDRKISEYQLSLEIGKSKSYIQAITSGRTLPSVDALIDICHYFDISMEEFFSENNRNPQASRRFIDKLGRLSNEQLQVVEATIDCFLNNQH